MSLLKKRQRGSAMILAMLTSMVVAGMVLAATGEMSAVRRTTQVEFQAGAQARSLAEAGLVDAYAWFRRQTVQPVAVFLPQLDLKADPVINETDDPEIGLVREFEISPGLWGRYVVERGTAAEPFTDEDDNGAWSTDEYFQDLNGDGRWTASEGTRDVTAERGLPGTGAVWLVEATGTVFRRPRADLALGEGVNSRLAVARVATEMRRLTIAPPAEAVICAERLDRVKIGNRGRLRGDVTGVTAAENTGSISVYSGGEVLTSRTSAKLPDYFTTVRNLFGVDLTQLKSMADISTAQGVDGLPQVIPDYNLVVVEGDVTFTADHPLRGTGVLVVNGNLTISDGSNSFFNGVIHVAGNLRLRAPAYLRGTIIARGSVDLAGTGGDYVEVEHDDGIISRLLTVMGQYRLSKANYVPGRVTEDGRPRDALGPQAAPDGTVVVDTTGTGNNEGTPTELVQGAEETLDTWRTDTYADQVEAAEKADEAWQNVHTAREALESDPQDVALAKSQIEAALGIIEAGLDADLFDPAEAESLMEELALAQQGL